MEEEMTIKKSTIWKFATMLFVLLFVISLFTGAFGIGSDSTGAAVKQPLAPTAAAIAPTAPAPTVGAGGGCGIY